MYDWCLWFVDIPRGPRLEQVFSIPKGALIGADLWIRPQKKTQNKHDAFAAEHV